ncbi:hypothetical protein AVEN_193549-1 [Araneus ventricosus]|uniref:Uncharacterized protein n=1 Tax=Araneus ventricosus TaxID=182803 RepID=A0A4Y2IZJ4_ARAVE|nr:hypothetical protein AVEN_193549-1 [Araneus ventricosus]
MTNLFVLFGDKVVFTLTKGRVKDRLGENHGSPGLSSNSWMQHYVWTLFYYGFLDKPGKYGLKSLFGDSRLYSICPFLIFPRRIVMP